MIRLLILGLLLIGCTTDRTEYVEMNIACKKLANKLGGDYLVDYSVSDRLRCSIIDSRVDITYRMYRGIDHVRGALEGIKLYQEFETNLKEEECRKNAKNIYEKSDCRDKYDFF